ncbi:antimicrobial peptide system SdpB family protein [Streptomyces achromogenes]|uniref:sporulation-delaying protein SdpB family protein n=1 Tax=Streptomyces achromogenes TaxID=67255 RepID=UPI00277E1EB7|nr:sporulation-delaying protein SdpB family protein [Streptomyces achromogenes]MDQ0831411.1 antimicrobial peptide system SdpB family protein [Streptomyces achromogenes]
MLKRSRTVPLPWAAGYGLARTLLALGTLGTLVFSDATTLFREVATVGRYPLCQGVNSAGAFCQVSEDHYDAMRWACCLVLVVAASGWRPRFTAIPHAYVAFSVFTGIAIPDGGDQITWILTLLIVAVALGDPRRWHWQPAPPPDSPPSNRRNRWALLGVSALTVARIQMSVLYFQSCVAKLPHAEWADGSALYYWINNYDFGAPYWLRPTLESVVDHPVGVAAMTWGPLILELALAAALLMPQRARWMLLPAGVSFHLCIAAVMGLWSFALAMCAGLLLLLTPLGHDPDFTRMLRRTPRPSAVPAEKKDPVEAPVMAGTQP